ncbi:uncharacterized protein LOC143085021 isoform X4 [Mytilus galloprovincialis]|uniref:uncharacterized protein LOC143085021 isoform X4 n=1 Tax=Mytilus galloprovincialis TaxID=29158 RepID=UPI003F7C0D90
MSRVFVFFIWISFTVKSIECTCSLPTEWDGTWYDSYRGDVVLDHNNAQVTSGWTLTSYSSSVSSFTCVTEDTGYFLFKGDSFVQLFSNDYNAFYCLKYTKITDYSYYYYLYSDTEANANNERAYVELYNAAVSTYAISTYCNPSTPPVTEEFHVMVKSGYESNIKQWFPTPLLGNFYYTHNDGSSDTCGANSVWDDCTNRTEAVFNYTLCSTQVLFSADGQLNCATYLSSGDTYYVSVLNLDTAVSSPTYRFTCMTVTQSGSTVYVSTNPGGCVAGQTSTVKTTDGGTVTLTPYSFTTDSATASAGFSIIPIIAAVVAILLILIIVFLACFLYKKHKKNNEEAKIQSSDMEKKPIESNGRVKEGTRVHPSTFDVESFVSGDKEDTMTEYSLYIKSVRFSESDMIVEPMTARDALSVDLPDEDDRGLVPMHDYPRPAPPSTPMSQAIRAQIPEMEQPSIPPISKR